MSGTGAGVGRGAEGLSVGEGGFGVGALEVPVQ